MVYVMRETEYYANNSKGSVPEMILSLSSITGMPHFTAPHCIVLQISISIFVVVTN